MDGILNKKPSSCENCIYNNYSLNCPIAEMYNDYVEKMENTDNKIALEIFESIIVWGDKACLVYDVFYPELKE